MTKYRIPLMMGVIVTLSACATKAPKAPDVYIPPPEIKTCTPTSELTRVVIPAEYQTYYAITEIENPPYEPIQRKEELQREVKPEEVIYQDAAGNQVTDICKEEPATSMAPTG